MIRPNTSPPELDRNDDSQVLSAFLKLLHLFRLFDQTKIFDIIQDDFAYATNLERNFLETLQRQLQEGALWSDQIPDVQKADICVTRHWMRVLLWKMSSEKRLLCSPPTDGPMSLTFPVVVAKELLNVVLQLPRSAIEAHGIGMELKIYEIANSLVDAVTVLASLPCPLEWALDSRPSNILARLQYFLSTFTGWRNKTLVDLLYSKMAETQLTHGLSLSTPLNILHPASRKSQGQDRIAPVVQEEDEPPSALAVAQGGPAVLECQLGSGSPLNLAQVNSNSNALHDYGKRSTPRTSAEEEYIDQDIHAMLYLQSLQPSPDCGDVVSTDPSQTPFGTNSIKTPPFQSQSFPPSWSRSNSAEMLFSDFLSSNPESQSPDAAIFERLLNVNTTLSDQSPG